MATIHGLYKTPLYGVWLNIKNRCMNSKCHNYHRYGGRGITVCAEWINDPVAFITWAFSHGYEKGLELDREENEGIYSPDNCRFVTHIVNNRNKRNNKLILYKSETKPLAEWAEFLNIDYRVLNNRMHRGWDFETAIQTI